MFHTGEHSSGFLLFRRASTPGTAWITKMTDLWGGLRIAARPLGFSTMRDREVIDSELHADAIQVRQSYCRSSG